MTSWLVTILYVYLAAVPELPGEQIVSVRADNSILYKGKSNSILIWVKVKDGYHIQANRVDDESLIPTTIDVNGDEKVIVRRTKFPKGKKFKLEGTSTYLKVYDEKFPIKLLIRIGPNANSGKYLLNAKLRYQACDSRTCLFPRAIEFSIPIEIKSGKSVQTSSLHALPANHLATKTKSLAGSSLPKLPKRGSELSLRK